MKLTYSAEADALSVDLLPNAKSAETRRLSPDVAADFDEHGRLIAIEVLHASAHYPRAQLEQLGEAIEWLSLAEAAKESGLAAATLRVQLNQGRLEGQKRGRDWHVARHVLWNYLESQDPRGRPATKHEARRIGEPSGPVIEAARRSPGGTVTLVQLPTGAAGRRTAHAGGCRPPPADRRRRRLVLEGGIPGLLGGPDCFAGLLIGRHAQGKARVKRERPGGAFAGPLSFPLPPTPNAHHPPAAVSF